MEEYVCVPKAHPTQEPTPARDPCDDLLSGRGSSTRNNCDGADPTATERPEPTATDPPEPTATPTPVPALGAPANFSAAGSGTSITLSWDTAANADGYEIEENDAFSCGQGGAGGSGASGNGASGSEEGARGACDNWFHLAFKGAGDTSHTVTGLTHGLTYDYRIRSQRTLAGSTDYSTYSYAGTSVPTATPTATTPPTTDPSATATATATPPLACPSISDRSYQVGASVTLSLPAATGGDGTLTYSVSGLPAGLSSSGSPPVVSGTPATAGDYTVTYQAEDADGDTCEEEFDITITEAPTAGPTPTPGGTPTPLGVPTELTSRQFASDQNSQGYLYGRILLEWNPPAGATNVTYEVEQREGYTSAQWQPVPSGRLTDTFHNPITVVHHSRVIVGGLEFQRVYEHRVRAVKDGVGSEWATVRTTMPLWYLGRQADHTVQYKIGTTDPLFPQTIDDHSLATAVAAWNFSAVGVYEPEILICKSGDCPVGRHDDRRVVTINTVTRFAENSCATQPSCARPMTPGPWADRDGQLKDLEIVVEQLADGYTIDRKLISYTWTLDPDMHGRQARPGYAFYHRFSYLPESIMHELGHAVGLVDIYWFTRLAGTTLMDYRDWGPAYIELKAFDVGYVRSVYDKHVPRSLGGRPTLQQGASFLTEVRP